MQNDNPWSIQPSNTDVVVARQQPSGRLPDDDQNTLTDVCVDSEHRSRNEIERQTTRVSFWDRLTGEGQSTVGVKQSIIALASYSWLNAFLVVVPLAWAVNFIPNVSHEVNFGASLIALLPLVKLLHYAGDQLALNCGKITGDFVMITVNNSVETVTAILLLLKCELKVLQSTITGFILLRLLLVSGTSFITGGMRRRSQTPCASQSRLNQTMLMTGAFALLLPALFYNILNRSSHLTSGSINVPNTVESLRRQILDVSRALSPLLLIAYACSCTYLHYPPGCQETVFTEKDPEACIEPCDMTTDEEKPEVNFWVSLITIFIIGVLMMVTVECLVSSIQPMKTKVREEWFGLVLIPLVSYAADGVLVTVYFILSLFPWLGEPYKPAGSLAETRAIDLSVQFMLLWTPVLILIGWILGQPISLLFDLFEVVLLIAACVLLNCVAFDSKTSRAEGVMMVVFYFMIAITAWFYPGSQDIRNMLKCNALSTTTMPI